MPPATTLGDVADSKESIHHIHHHAIRSPPLYIAIFILVGLSIGLIPLCFVCRLRARSRKNSDPLDNTQFVSPLATCPMCHLRIAPKSPTTHVGCGHQYHAGCVENWLAVGWSCPACQGRSKTVRVQPKLEVQ